MPDKTEAEMAALFEKFKRLNDLNIAAMTAQEAHDRESARIAEELRKSYDASWRRVWAVEQRIIDTPAQTIQGLAFKAAIFKIGETDAMQESIIEDLLRLGGLAVSTAEQPKEAIGAQASRR
jgi:hypothetical protein